jgi:hypothetical protein
MRTFFGARRSRYERRSSGDRSRRRGQDVRRRWRRPARDGHRSGRGALGWRRDSADPPGPVGDRRRCDESAGCGRHVLGHRDRQCGPRSRGCLLACVRKPFAIGATVVSCTATDDAGNSASATFTVTVRGAAEQLAALRGEVALLPDEKVGRSLGGKLRDASNALTAGQTPKACSRLAAFIAEVQVHAGTKVPAATATKWVADANRIRAVIGC